MSASKTNFERFSTFLLQPRELSNIILFLPLTVKTKTAAECSAAAKGLCLLLAEGLAVGALVHSGVGLVSTHHNTVQGAVVCIIAVVSALSNGTFNTLISITVHISFPPLF